MKKLIFALIVVVIALVPVFLAQQNGTSAPIVKVEILEKGVYKYKGETKGIVMFNHNQHTEMLDGDCESCHDGEPAKIEVSDMSSGHGLCGRCHDQTDDMNACNFCHSK